jgi:hypothetical protein
MSWRKNIATFLTGSANPVKAVRSGSITQRLAAASGIGMASGFAVEAMGLPVASAIKEMITGEKAQRERQLFQLEQQLMERARMQEAQSRQNQMYIQMNSQNLMTYAPDLAQRVLAGRRLTQGGVAIGGRPRTDLLTELASHMSDGSLQ